MWSWFSSHWASNAVCSQPNAVKPESVTGEPSLEVANGSATLQRGRSTADGLALRSQVVGRIWFGCSRGVCHRRRLPSNQMTVYAACADCISPTHLNSECCESAKSGALTVSLLFYTMRFQIVNSYRSGIRRNQSNILLASSTCNAPAGAMCSSANMTKHAISYSEVRCVFSAG